MEQLLTPIKPSKWLALLALLFVLFMGFEAQASHLAGGDVEYKCIGNRKWEIRLVLYRDCTGISICNGPSGSQTACTVSVTARPTVRPGLNPVGCSPGSIPQITITLTSWKIEDVGKSVVDICGQSAKSLCTNNGTITPGTQEPALEGVYYKGILDMSSSLFNNVCPYWDIAWTSCCRNDGIKNLQNSSGEGFYIAATVNIYANQSGCKNNSPEMRNEAVAVICSSQEVVFNMGAVDPDRDSLTYRIAPSKSSQTADVVYQSPFGPAVPFALTSTQAPHVNFPQPNGPYVIIDSITGDLMLNGINNSTATIFGNINVEIWQWSYDVNGLPYVVGITHRDIQLYLKRCPNNNPPRFATSPSLPNGWPKYNWSVCAGEQLCFTITAKDTDDQPSVTLGDGKHIDTTIITWNNGISRPGKLTFEPDYDPNIPSQRPREDRWKFCWQTEESDGATLPYYFTVTGTDDFCPTVGRVVRAFGITVVAMPSASHDFPPGLCGKHVVNVRKTKPKQTFSSAKLEIAKEPEDFSMLGGAYVTNAPTPNPPSVPGNPSAPRLLISDTVQFTKGGRYLIKYTISIPGVEAGQFCSRIFYDTLVVDTQVVANTFDTIVCKFNPTLVTGAGKWGTPPYTYRWYKTVGTGTPVNGPNFAANNNYTVNDTVDTKYILEVRDLKGCKSFDTSNVDVKPLPLPNFPTDSIRICSYDTFRLNAGNNGGNIRSYTWFKNQIVLPDTTQSIVRNDSGTFVIRHTDNFGCINRDTFRLFVNQPVIANAGIDTAACPGDSVVLFGTGGFKYKWDRIAGATLVNLVPKGYRDFVKVGVPANSVPASTNYLVTTYVSYPDSSKSYKECFNVDTVNVKARQVPILTRPEQRNICSSTDTLILPVFSVSPASQAPAAGGIGVWSYAPAPGGVFLSGTLPAILVDSFKNIPRDTFYNNIVNNTAGATRTNWVKFTYTGPVSAGSCVKVDSAAIRIFALPKVDAGLTTQRCITAGVYPLNSTGGHVSSPQDNSGKNGVWSVVIGGGLVTSTSGGDDKFTFDPKKPDVNQVPLFNLLNYRYTTNYLTTPQSGNLACSNQDTVRINVVQPPVVDAGSNVKVCKNEPIFIISTKSGATNSSSIPNSTYWHMKPGQIPNISAAIINGRQFEALNPAVPPAGNTWTLYYSDTSSGCLARDSMQLTVSPLPNVNLAINPTDSVVCKTSAQVKLTATPIGGVFGGTAVSTAGIFNVQDPLVIPEKSYMSTYSFVDANNCSGVDSVSIFVQAPPVVTVSPVNAKCDNDNTPFNLTATITPARYGVLWTTDGTGTLTNPTQPNTDYNFTPADAAAKVVRATVTSTQNGVCAADVKMVNMNIDPKPNSDFIFDSAGCQPHNADFAAVGAGVGGSTYAWYFGNEANPSETDSAFNREFTTWQTTPVKLVVTTPAGCNTETVKTLYVYAIPEAKFEYDPPTTTIAKPYFNFTNTSVSPDGSGINYVWNFGPDPTKPSDPTDRLVVEESPKNIPFAADTGKIEILLTVTSEHGCVDTAIRYVQIDPDITVFIPSAFMPVDGGNNVPCADPTFNDCNDVFRVMAHGFSTIEIYVFNRWGQQVFYTTNSDIGWNGKINNTGGVCPQDVYIYQINASSFSGKKYNYSGSITLLR